MEARRLPQGRIELSKDGNSMLLRDLDGKDHPIECNLTDVAAQQYRELLRDGLDEMKKSLRGDILTIADADAALREFNKRGLSVLWSIFGENLLEAVKAFRTCFPGWNSLQEPVSITIVAELSRFVPLELLPIFDPTNWPSIPSDQQALSVLVRRFPGFCAIIKREFPRLPVSHDLVLKNDPKLPLRCFGNVDYQDLPAAAKELGFFKSKGEYFDLKGPWPPSTGLSAQDFSEKLLNYLQFAEESSDEETESPIDEIQHFICHCDIDSKLFAQSFLRLSQENEIRIWELQAAFAAHAVAESPRAKPQSAPLIFLNACGASRIDPMAVTSFPQLFVVDNKNRGFIGTETNVPDDFAAAFSAAFYTELLGGSTLGKAIQNAKWKMLLEQNNPLGIIYTVYADPDLHVSRKVDIAA